jgi:hypothetical protein
MCPSPDLILKNRQNNKSSKRELCLAFRKKFIVIYACVQISYLHNLFNVYKHGVLGSGIYEKPKEGPLDNFFLCFLGGPGGLVFIAILMPWVSVRGVIMCGI